MRMTAETVGIRLFVCLSVPVRAGWVFGQHASPIGALDSGRSGGDPIGSRSLFFVMDFSFVKLFFKLFSKTRILTGFPAIKLEINPKLNQ